MPDVQTTSPVSSLSSILAELRDVLHAIGDKAYSFSSGGASPGAHVRHSLDHIRALLDGQQSGLVDYDTRLRNTEIEHSRVAAIEEIERLLERLDHLEYSDLDTEVQLALLTAAFTDRYRTASSLGRELAFVVHHTIHHNALLAVLLRNMGIELPQYFGYAPSTIEALS